jgi:hypothetical protein
MMPSLEPTSMLKTQPVLANLFRVPAASLLDPTAYQRIAGW